MQTKNRTNITVEATVNVPVEKAWEYFTKPEHITKWNFASDDWHCPEAKNDLQPGGKLLARTEAKDESFGFDFEAVYETVEPYEKIEYTIADGRKVRIDFKPQGNATHVTEIFEAEDTNSLDMQKTGWQAIMDNYKKYTENN